MSTGTARLCSSGGLFGKCAAGMQMCTSGIWGACSITPSAADTCEPGNDDNCNGRLNEGCVCVHGATQTCAADGKKGACAAGTEMCDVAGRWGPCSIQPKTADTCSSTDNDDDCNGIPFEGCQCVNGTSPSCNSCGDTLPCSGGKKVGICPSCCPTPVRDDWRTFTLNWSSSPWRIAWPPEPQDPGTLPPWVDATPPGALLLRRDSVVTRSPELPGSYVVAFDAALDDSFAFHVDFGLLGNGPAFRRVGTGPITVGGLIYGRGEAWGSFGAWNGSTEAGAGTVHVTVYVKASGQVAASATAGATVSSGFVNAPMKDPKILQLIGSNLPAYDLSTKMVRISTIVGCAGLSDSQVQALYTSGTTYP